MKSEMDPKVVIGIVAAVVVIAAAGIYFGTAGQGNRSGPKVEAKYQGGRSLGGGGWHPGMTQSASNGAAPAPGSQAPQSTSTGK